MNGFKLMISYDLCGQASQFYVFSLCLKAHLAKCLHRFQNVNALVDTFNQENALVGAFSGHCENFADLR